MLVRSSRLTLCNSCFTEGQPQGWKWKPGVLDSPPVGRLTGSNAACAILFTPKALSPLAPPNSPLYRVGGGWER